jgi:enhancing lycopene biosynthesis protein 2
MSKKALVLLSGCGVYDGAEIHESVLCLLELTKKGIAYQCAAPDVQQHHVINHISGEEMQESRNVWVESARIARGDIKKSSEVQMSQYDALVMPGGFGAAKNFTKWAFQGPEGSILPEIKQLIADAVLLKKPIVAVCMSPTVVAKALEGFVQPTLTVGTTKEKSPYDIAGINAGIEKTGAKANLNSVHEVTFDKQLNIITSPCYMMEANIADVHLGIEKAITLLAQQLK